MSATEILAVTGPPHILLLHPSGGVSDLGKEQEQYLVRVNRAAFKFWLVPTRFRFQSVGLCRYNDGVEYS